MLHEALSFAKLYVTHCVELATSHSYGYSSQPQRKPGPVCWRVRWSPSLICLPVSLSNPEHFAFSHLTWGFVYFSFIGTGNMKLFKHSSICQCWVLQVECRVWFQIIISCVAKKPLEEDEKDGFVQTALWLKCTKTLLCNVDHNLIHAPHVSLQSQQQPLWHSWWTSKNCPQCKADLDPELWSSLWVVLYP